MGPVAGSLLKGTSFFARFAGFGGVGAISQTTGDLLGDLIGGTAPEVNIRKAFLAFLLSGGVSSIGQHSYTLGGLFARQLGLSARGWNLAGTFSTLLSPWSSPAARFLWTWWGFEAMAVMTGVELLEEFS